MKQKILLGIFFVVVIIAASFRLYHLNWDQNYHMHPDERAIVLAVLKLDYPKSITDFFSSNSSWNTHFFAYGSFPFYLLKIITSVFTAFASYDGLTLMGRFLSALFDLGTLIVLYFLGKRSANQTVGVLSSFFYAVSVLPIQLSHFYAVDTPLTFFTLLSLYFAVWFYESPTKKKAFLIGLAFGLALATKVSAVVLVVSFIIMMISDFLFPFLSRPHRSRHYLPHLPKLLRNILLYGLIMALTTVVVFFILNPYAIIDHQEFWDQTLQQQAMTKDAFTFPYTLQYVGKIPYLYELKNITLFGLGVPLAVICLLGTVMTLIQTIMALPKKQGRKELILLSFFITYFAIVGHFAIGFMRYMLPLYPLLCLFGALLIYQCLNRIPLLFLRFALCALLFATLLVWPLSFIHIYTVPNTRIQATEWINSHIPPGKTLAIEHWDDALPITGQEKYTMLTLPLYDPDTPDKWSAIDASLSKTDNIIIASNRLYVPLLKLTDCQKLPPMRCYPQTADYYKNLFSGALGFQKVAEFAVYPTIPFTNITINDQGADESFTVYDHPKIMIFQKEK